MKNHSQGLRYLSNRDGTCTIVSIGACKDKKIIIPPRSPSGDVVTSIAEGAFGGLDLLISVEIPASVMSIEHGVFRNCTSLTSVTFAENSQLTSIGNYAFCNCTSLNSEPQAYKAFLLGPRHTLWSQQNQKQYWLNHNSFARGPLECGTNGLHYCTKLFDIFDYYFGEYGEDFVIAICDVSSENIGHVYDSKRCARWLRPTKILTREELIQLLNTRKE